MMLFNTDIPTWGNAVVKNWKIKDILAIFCLFVVSFHTYLNKTLQFCIWPENSTHIQLTSEQPTQNHLTVRCGSSISHGLRWIVALSYPLVQRSMWTWTHYVADWCPRRTLHTAHYPPQWDYRGSYCYNISLWESQSLSILSWTVIWNKTTIES